MSNPLERIRRGSSEEDGWVVVTALLLMTIMLGVGAAVVATANTQSAQSSTSRARESAFNLAEGLMHAQSVVLQTNWPVNPPCAGNDTGCGYAWSLTDPNSCTQATAASNPKQCPNPANLVGSYGAFSNVDQSLPSTTWSVQVRDDTGVCLSTPPAGYVPYYDSCQIPTYYSGFCPAPNKTDATKCWPATAPHNYSTNPNEAPGVDQTLCTNSGQAVACTWDANGDKQLWVRVDATVAGKTRSMVALLRLEDFPVTLNSQNAVIGGAVNFSNNGNKHIVDATGSQIVTRCIPTDNFGGGPTTGNQLKTILAADVATGNTTDTIAIPAAAAGFANLPAGTVLALGADSGTVPPSELLVIMTNTVAGGIRTIRFRSNVMYPHRASDGSNLVELAPAPPNATPVPNNCEGWISPLASSQTGADKHQLDAPQNYKSDPAYPNFLDPAVYAGVISGLKAWTTCPTSWSGNIYIKSVPAGTTCTVPSGTYNSAASPHFIFVENQAGGCSSPALKLSGSTVFFGVIYMVNKQNCGFNQTIMEIAAGGQLQGGVTVDGNARIEIGNASNTGNCAIVGGSGTDTYCPTIKYDRLAFSSVTATGAAGLVQNTWRELAARQ